jgi:sarcosine oxidase subunit alpha
MRYMRLIPGVAPGTSVSFRFDREKLTGFEGEAIASALLRAGIGHQRVSRKLLEPRAYYCGMGLCWECAVRVEGVGVVRGCVYPLREGLDVRTADGAQG